MRDYEKNSVDHLYSVLNIFRITLCDDERKRGNWIFLMGESLSVLIDRIEESER